MAGRNAVPRQRAKVCARPTSRHPGRSLRIHPIFFFGQWQALRNRASQLGISIIGDTPIFTALDSADVWASPHLFQLDKKTLRPTAVAGVPPDYFSADGQLWGNPLYDWAAHAADGYTWWLDRLRANFALCDVVRLDHFRGFDAYWAIPASAPTARTGSWQPGPGIDFFKKVRRAMPAVKLIAEDLGELSPSVVTLREATGLPGMAILQFAFGGDAKTSIFPTTSAPTASFIPARTTTTRRSAGMPPRTNKRAITSDVIFA